MTSDDVSAAYRRYGHLVAARCRRIVREDAIAEDAVQETFLRLWKHPDGFLAADSKLAWLYRVAERCCFDQLAKRRSRREDPIDEHPPQAPAWTSPPHEDWQVVQRFLDRFDERVQQIAVLHYLDEMSQVEIAEITGWSRQTVIKKLQHLAERAQALRPSLLEGGQRG